jgi:uncharacterized protein YecE (DUF72 family)
MPAIRLGAQGWNYPAWVGPFYPRGTRPRDFLETYARVFDTVEVDSTFYAVPPVATVRGWRDRTPDGFTFALKLPREITHERRFVDVGDVTTRFLEAARELGPKLGPVLIQCGADLPTEVRPDLEAFLHALPSDVRFAIEFRDRRWITEEMHAMLAAQRIALALADARWVPRKWMLGLAARPTADHAYVRWLGPDRTITDYSRLQEDRTAEIGAWAAVLPTVAKAVTVFGYVNNHFAGHSPASLRMLQTALGQIPQDPAQLDAQFGLF